MTFDYLVPASCRSGIGTVRIVSFGFGHAEPPAAHLLVDLRVHFRDPHVSPDLRGKTARDAEVREAVMSTSGANLLVVGLADTVDGFVHGPAAAGAPGVVTTTPVVVAVGCSGGRHRAPTIASALAAALTGNVQAAIRYGLAHAAGQYVQRSLDVTLHHRDLDKPVIQRPEVTK
ncbi:ATPase [Streptomyces sp. Ac-502]|uniref:RapZ C-terminal domain-containing protein n=1 Tax=Streptomyces sp. Ac-502 TaxID=3342801 RepID=UPI0038623C34